MSERLDLEQVDWLGHASFRIRGSKTLYIDPWKIGTSPRDGDLVLVTHDHYDHLSSEDIARVAEQSATVVVPASSAESLDWPAKSPVSPGESLDLGGVIVHAVPAYNTNKDYHPRSQKWVGYIIEMDGVRIYHSGDTDLIDEMKDIDCDIALLPVSGTYVMTADEAVKAVDRIKPKKAVPMHWGEIVGGRKDAEHFQENAACEVVIKEPVA